MNKVCIPTSKGIKEVMTANIIRVEASSNYSKVYFMNEYPLTVAKLLQWFENKLPVTIFFRIHRGHIVNREFITAISADNKLILSNGEQFQVSRRKQTAFRKMVI
ncbi:MAG: LytTR family DNA-binding domain-containing protein [Chitinophagaceae bacterium]